MRKYNATCNGKRSYASEAEAYRALLHRLNKTTGLRVYRCCKPKCNKWHLTSQVSMPNDI